MRELIQHFQERFQSRDVVRVVEDDRRAVVIENVEPARHLIDVGMEGLQDRCECPRAATPAPRRRLPRRARSRC